MSELVLKGLEGRISSRKIKKIIINIEAEGRTTEDVE